MYRILVVDDDEQVCRTIKATLEFGGEYEVITATDGKSGLRAARREIPDLILLDIEMPKMDGLEMLKRLREDDHVGLIPVIMVTADETQESLEVAMHDFAEQYVTKPFRQGELKRKIERVLKLIAE